MTLIKVGGKDGRVLEIYKTEKLALFAFRRRLPNPEIYAPQKGDIDFAHDVKEGTWWRCVIKATKSGRYKWYSAEPIEHN